ncbi:Phosphate acyltransferase [Gossypium australe]|uniref:Phosphate acyltransferase n=1 Tax=Gossypium australe TaxID=47621 RepID=A0A5B6VS39_9ROSI|nr:Phosphate acyltransferase [Gossypium australe]
MFEPVSNTNTSSNMKSSSDIDFRIQHRDSRKREPCLKEIYATDDDASLPPLEAISPCCLSFLLEDTIPLGELQCGSEMFEAQYGASGLPFSPKDNQMGSLSESKNKNGKLVLGNFSEDEGQDTKINNVIPVGQDHRSFLAREMLKRDYSSWQIKFFNEDNNKVDVAGFPGLEQALQEADCRGLPDNLKPIAAQIENARGKATEFPHKNIEVLICATIKEMEEWCTPKDSGWGQLKKWAATLKMGKQFGFEVKFADNMLENISLACFAYSMIFEGG